MTWAFRFLLLGLGSTGLTLQICKYCLSPETHGMRKAFAVFLALLGAVFSFVNFHISSLRCSQSHTLRTLLGSYVSHTLIRLAYPFVAYKVSKQWKNPRDSQENRLRLLTTRDAKTEYGRKFQLGKIKTLRDLQSKHPITTYDHYRPYVQRLADGEDGVFLGDTIRRFGITSGTTGSGKLIPMIHATIGNGAVTVLNIKVTDRAFGRPSPLQRGCILYCKPAPAVTKSGLDVAPLIYFSEKDKTMLMAMQNAPFEAFQIMTDFEAAYVHLLFGIADRNLSFFYGGFTSMTHRAFKLLEDNWEQMLTDLITGRLNPKLNIEDNVRAGLEAVLVPDPDRVDQLRSEFSKGFKGVVARIWPYLHYIFCVDMAGFKKKLQEGYAKGTPIFTGAYSCTETLLGINLWVADEPKYVLVPGDVVYEFIPEELCQEKYPLQIYLIDEVEVSKRYELMVTITNGFFRYRFGDVVEVVDFHYNCPVIQMRYRTGELLNLNGEKIDVNLMFTVIRETVAGWPLRALVDWTCAESPLLYAHKKDPYEMYYLIFIEVEEEVGQRLTEAERSEFDKILRKHHSLYDHYRAVGTIAAPRMLRVRPGSFKKFQDYIIANSTASYNQFKMPRKLRTKMMLDYMMNMTTE
ncbi:probable indole-3-acetic acid-amido synthetase GH3.9 [Patiria miniata]|uniref:GH3 domain-containing protein n=1 Tax=Patiria miniata TaxID=46514 RepID=A0A913ZJG7_PATMI|nr:probable indole-3-acetic acid-amido synthetase GH3.9 [Patiria miniata]